MAIYLDNANEGLTITGLITDEPWSIACWYNSDISAVYRTLIQVSKDNPANWSDNTNDLQVMDSDFARLMSCITGSCAIASNDRVTEQTWQFHGGAVSVNGASRKHFLNTLKASDANARNFTDLARCSVGVTYSGGAVGGNPAGSLAEVGIWNIELDDSDFTSLAGGDAPSLVRPANLIAYLPFIDNLTDEKGNSWTSNVTGFTVTTHPTINYPTPSGSVLPILRRHYQTICSGI